MENPIKSREPALTPYEVEQQAIAMANELAYKQLREGTASAQVILHFLRMGSERERLEMENLQQQTALTAAKVSAIQEAKTEGEKYVRAIEAMKRYSGNDTNDPNVQPDYLNTNL